MVDDARIDAGAAAYRGFLFTDMRGFTAFAERYGNSAAAARVGRFLEIARKAIARYDGAEIKTEGDAIHAVFPSASSAVLCGLEIVDAATDLNAHEPGSPLNLGVGVHAGEAVETPEGYIGTAVNVAARLCAVALPGEVLVSSTVKSIVQTSVPVGFIARGHRRLKGIHDPVEVYAATRDMTARASVSASGNVVLAAMVGGLAVLGAIAAIVAPQVVTNRTAGPSAGAGPSVPAAPSAQPVVIGPLPIGSYASSRFQPPITFSIGDLGWTANRDTPDMFGLLRADAPRGFVSFLRVAEVIDNPCISGGESGQTAPAAVDVIARLRELTTHLTVDEPTPVDVGGLKGQQVDVTVADAALAACGGLVGGGAAIFRVGEDVWSATPGERFRLISVEVRDEAVTIVMSTDWTQTPSVQELEGLLGLGQRIVDSVGF